MCRASPCAARFDDCQRLVKEAFLRRGSCAQRCELSSANSINLGRLLPQAVYYAASEPGDAGGARGDGVVRDSERQSRQCRRLRLGAALGLPIDRIVLAHNANRTVPDFLETGDVRAAAEHADAGLGDGCRQPEQSGAAA